MLQLLYSTHRNVPEEVFQLVLQLTALLAREQHTLPNTRNATTAQLVRSSSDIPPNSSTLR